jgi:hypothetical protein
MFDKWKKLHTTMPILKKVKKVKPREGISCAELRFAGAVRGREIMALSIKLMTITLLVFFLNIQLKGKEDGCKLISDTIPQFQILDTIEILEPRIFFISGKFNSVSCTTGIVCSKTSLDKIKLEKGMNVGDILNNKDCYVYEDYDHLIDILWLSTRDSTLPFGISEDKWKSDSCVTINNKIKCYSRKSGSFIVVRQTLEHYFHFEAIKYKRRKAHNKYVLVAYSVPARIPSRGIE